MTEKTECNRWCESWWGWLTICAIMMSTEATRNGCSVWVWVCVIMRGMKIKTSEIYEIISGEKCVCFRLWLFEFLLMLHHKKLIDAVEKNHEFMTSNNTYVSVARRGEISQTQRSRMKYSVSWSLIFIQLLAFYCFLLQFKLILHDLSVILFWFKPFQKRSAWSESSQKTSNPVEFHTQNYFLISVFKLSSAWIDEWKKCVELKSRWEPETCEWETQLFWFLWHSKKNFSIRFLAYLI